MAEQKWFEGLRRQIKHRCGPGWGIDERHGGVRLTRRIAAGKQHKNPRQTVQLGIAWNPAEKCFGGFAYGVEQHCRTVLGCNLRRGQLQQGEHLTKQCKYWSSVSDMETGGTVAA